MKDMVQSPRTLKCWTIPMTQFWPW